MEIKIGIKVQGAEHFNFFLKKPLSFETLLLHFPLFFLFFNRLKRNGSTTILSQTSTSEVPLVPRRSWRHGSKAHRYGASHARVDDRA
ncbi:hypothetical protein ES332_A11G107900v1 [Gossypium tomentosum]|uniref:Uncharacterized protein n=1 Tax=Gossypium tomentosum TaxID=34277 RepID=A0A5D2N9V4_GOSTO|nr:hypothetical protein ES332_A11G107900v1 [Gossypium tomentosum]